MQMAYLFPDRVDAVVLVSSGGLGRELNPLLRAATLPGSELVLPVLASSWLHGIGDTALRLWGKAGLAGGQPQHRRSLAKGCRAWPTATPGARSWPPAGR